jgi:hypothetical protein
MTGAGDDVEVELTRLVGDGAATEAEKGMLGINGESAPHNLNPHPPLAFARSDPTSPVVIVGGGGNFIGVAQSAATAPTLLSAIKSRKALTHVSEASLASIASINSCFTVTSSALTDRSSWRNLSSSSESTAATPADGFESETCRGSVAVVVDISLVGDDSCPNIPERRCELLGGGLDA